MAGHPLGTREPPRQPPARAARHQDVALGHLEKRAWILDIVHCEYCEEMSTVKIATLNFNIDTAMYTQ